MPLHISVLPIMIVLGNSTGMYIDLEEVIKRFPKLFKNLTPESFIAKYGLKKNRDFISIKFDDETVLDDKTVSSDNESESELLSDSECSDSECSDGKESDEPKVETKKDVLKQAPKTRVKKVVLGDEESSDDESRRVSVKKIVLSSDPDEASECPPDEESDTPQKFKAKESFELELMRKELEIVQKNLQLAKKDVEIGNLNRELDRVKSRLVSLRRVKDKEIADLKLKIK